LSEPSEIRLAGWEDRAELARLRRAWVEEQAGAAVEDDGFERRFDAWLERERHQRVAWLAVADGLAVGMLNLMVFTRMPRPGRPEPSRWGYVANVYVDPVHRDRGVGGLLLGACTAYADEHGFVRLVLSPSERSVPLYRRGGFAPAVELMVREP
jgi:GNAT superfamily N-acetyltransferase